MSRELLVVRGARVARLCLLWVAHLRLYSAAPRSLPPNPADGITKEMVDQEEFNRKQGFAMGVTGEYFRYKHLFMKQPSEQDREEAIGVGTKIKCDVCVATVESLLSKASSLSEDNIADVLEGNVEYEPTGDFVTDRMLSHKKGCNKHFKDELVAEGWTLRSCKDVFPDRSDSEPCLYKDAQSRPNQQAIDSYEVWKECIFHACEQTVSRFSDSLAEYLAEELPGSSNRSATVRTACEKQARCAARVERPTGGQPAKKGKATPATTAEKSGRGKAKRRRRRSKQNSDL